MLEISCDKYSTAEQKYKHKGRTRALAEFNWPNTKFVSNGFRLHITVYLELEYTDQCHWRYFI